MRLVKGAYWDYETVMAAQQAGRCRSSRTSGETDANYERLTRFLLENHDWLRPAFGSHNVRSLAHALAAAQLLGLPPRQLSKSRCSTAWPTRSRTRWWRLGQRVRVYTPYGQLLPGMAYLVRRLLENTANESFLRASFTEHVPEETIAHEPARRSSIGEHSAPMTAGAATACRHADRACRVSQRAADRLQPRSEPRRPCSRRSTRSASSSARTIRWSSTASDVDAASTIDVGQSVAHSARSSAAAARRRRSRRRQRSPRRRRRFPAWRDTDPAERAEYLVRAAESCGGGASSWRPGRSTSAASRGARPTPTSPRPSTYCEYYAREMLRLAEPQQRDVPGEENAYFYEPRGVAVVIAPWNFPLAILCGMTTAALVTGNTVIMKPAEQSAVIAAKLMEVFQEAGLPPGVVNYLPGIGEEIGPTLVDHPDVALIAFTGSRGVGLLHQPRRPPKCRRARTTSSACIAEMGGKNAIIVDDDADLDEAVHGVVASAFGYRAEMLGLLAGHRAGVDLRRVPGPADRGDAQPEGRPGRGSRLHASARSSTPRRSSAS